MRRSVFSATSLALVVAAGILTAGTPASATTPWLTWSQKQVMPGESLIETVTTNSPGGWRSCKYRNGVLVTDAKTDDGTLLPACNDFPSGASYVTRPGGVPYDTLVRVFGGTGVVAIRWFEPGATAPDPQRLDDPSPRGSFIVSLALGVPLAEPTPTVVTPAAGKPAAATLRFAVGQSTLSSAARRQLAAAVAKATTSATFTVQGFISGRGRDARAAVASARANAVAAELQRLGVPAASIKASAAKKASGSIVKVSARPAQ